MLARVPPDSYVGADHLTLLSVAACGCSCFHFTPSSVQQHRACAVAPVLLRNAGGLHVVLVCAAADEADAAHVGLLGWRVTTAGHVQLFPHDPPTVTVSIRVPRVHRATDSATPGLNWITNYYIAKFSYARY